MTPDPEMLRVTVEIAEGPEEVARRGAAEIAEVAREAVRARGPCAIAVSGGTAPWAIFAALAGEDRPWRALGIWQVDERIAPRGHEDRGLTHLETSLPASGVAALHPMPVDALHPMPVDALNPDDEEACVAAAEAYTRRGFRRAST